MIRRFKRCPPINLEPPSHKQLIATEVFFSHISVLGETGLLGQRGCGYARKFLPATTTLAIIVENVEENLSAITLNQFRAAGPTT